MENIFLFRHNRLKRDFLISSTIDFNENFPLWPEWTKTGIFHYWYDRLNREFFISDLIDLIENLKSLKKSITLRIF